MKTCSDCGESLPLELFGPAWNKQRNKHVYRSHCNPCRGIRRRGNEAERAYRRKRYWADPERFRQEAREYASANLDKLSARRRERYQEDETYRRNVLSWNLKSRIGLTFAERAALLLDQGGVCAICGTDNPGQWPGWCVDHDHTCCPSQKTCGECVRGILCASCNLAIGQFGDDVERMRSAIDYLDRSRALTG